MCSTKYKKETIHFLVFTQITDTVNALISAMFSTLRQFCAKYYEHSNFFLNETCVNISICSLKQKKYYVFKLQILFYFK